MKAIERITFENWNTKATEEEILKAMSVDGARITINYYGNKPRFTLWYKSTTDRFGSSNIHHNHIDGRVIRGMEKRGVLVGTMSELKLNK